MRKRHNRIDGQRALYNALRVLRQQHRCRIAAVAPAVRTDARRIHKLEGVPQIGEHAHLILNVDGAQFALDLRLRLFAVELAAAAIDLHDDHRSLAAQIPVPIDAKLLRHDLGAGGGVPVRGI